MAATPAAGYAAPRAAGERVAPSASRAWARKRTSSVPKPGADIELDAPVVYAIQRGRNTPTSLASGDSGCHYAYLSDPKDRSQIIHGVHQKEYHAEHHRTNLPRDEDTPISQKPVKHVRLKETHSKRSASAIWDVTGHFLSRMCLILFIGAGLGPSLWNWKGRHEVSSSVGVDDGLLPTEVKKLEEFVAKTAKWTQVQLEVVDVHLAQEVAGLRKELQQSLDSQHLQLKSDVKDVKEKIKKVGSVLDVLFSKGGPLGKAEGLVLINDVVDKRAAKGEGKTLSLDDVRTAARQIVAQELERHSADGIGRTDYALGSGGGRVIGHSPEYFFPKGTSWWNVVDNLPGILGYRSFSDKILQPSFGEPGQCLPLKGSNVWVDISLRTAIYPDSISIEHVSKDIAFDVSSAPKDFRVFGWRENRGHAADRTKNPVTSRPLGEFTYDVEKSSVQTFYLVDPDAAGFLVNVIRLQVLSNYGNPSHTCIYRVRVHGSDLAFSTPVAPTIRELSS